MLPLANPKRRRVEDGPLETSASLGNSPYVSVWLQECVDAIHNPAEEPSVQGFGHGIPDVCGSVHSVGADDGLTSSDHTVGREGLLQLFRADAENKGSWNKK